MTPPPKPVPFEPPPHAPETEAVYRELRERAPVLPITLPDGLTTWVITRYADGKRALKDPRFIKDPRALRDPQHGFGGVRHPEDLMIVGGRHMLNSDAEEHARLRGVATTVLSARAMARREPEITTIAHRLLDRAVQDRRAPHVGPAAEPAVDLMQAYAQPLPETALGRVLGMSDAATAEAAAHMRRVISRDHPLSPPWQRAYADLTDVLRDALATPQNSDDGDTVIAALQAAVAEGRLTRREVLSTVSIMFAGGISSTAIAIGHGAATLMQTTSVLRGLLDDEERATVVVEELLRHHAPFPFSPWRFAREPVEIAGTVVPEGAVVFIMLAATNRDPDVYDAPDTVIPERPDAPPHLAFGHGPHFCIGAHLARIEIRVALRVLFQRFPGIVPAVPYSDVIWKGVLFDRTPVALPVLLAGHPGPPPE